jgi:transposase
MARRHVSRDLKCCIPVLWLELGFSVKEICKILGIRRSLVYQTLRYHFIYGTTSNSLSQSHCGPQKLTSINIAFIHDILGQRHTTYLDEIQDELFSHCGTLVLIPTLARTLCRLDFSHKRVSAKAIERNELLCAAFMNKIGTEVPDPAMLMFTDETVKDKRMCFWKTGWAKVGKRCAQRKCFV